MFKLFLQIFTIALPWNVRRRVLQWCTGLNIAPSAKIGASLFLRVKGEIGVNAYIGNLNVFKDLQLLDIEESASIGNGNWVSGYPVGRSDHFSASPNRQSALLLKRHAAITSRHILDCSDTLSVGAFTTIAGYRSQFLTHSIEIKSSRQLALATEIGDYCFIGSGVIVLGGTSLPSYSVVAAGAVLNLRSDTSFALWAGVPARIVKSLDPGDKYFVRSEGRVM